MEIHFKVIGVLLILLALVHVFFPKYFNWKKELATLSMINREMMIVHTFFIAIVVLLMGLLCLLYSGELIGTNLGKIISLGLGVFWTLRLLIQLLGYSAELWKGIVFETTVHIVFSMLWFYFSAVFWCNYLY